MNERERQILAKIRRFNDEVAAIDRRWLEEAGSLVSVRDRASKAYREALAGAYDRLAPKYQPMIKRLTQKIERLARKIAVVEVEL